MKDTLKFYRSIYEPLFKQGYTKKTNRARPALRRGQRYFDEHDVTISSVIDVGCAWGKALKYWDKQGAHVVGVDVSKRAVKACRSAGFEAHIASATDLSRFEDKSFDLYMSTDMYEHLREDDVMNALNEAKRLSKRYILLRVHPTRDRRGTLHLTIWGSDKWQEYFEQFGLNILDIGDGDKKYYKACFLMEL